MPLVCSKGGHAGGSNSFGETLARQRLAPRRGAGSRSEGLYWLPLWLRFSPQADEPRRGDWVRAGKSPKGDWDPQACPVNLRPRALGLPTGANSVAKAGGLAPRKSWGEGTASAAIAGVGPVLGCARAFSRQRVVDLYL